MVEAKAKAVKDKSIPFLMKKYRLDLTYIFVLILVVLFVYSEVYDENIFIGGDNVVYFITGKAIASGEGYTNINSPFNSPATTFPPGYPFISAIAMTIFGKDIEVMNYANCFFLLGSLIFLYLISVRFTNNKHLSFVITLLTALNMHMLHYSFIAMSEMSFIFMSLGAIYFFIRMDKQSLPFKDKYFWLFFVFVIFSYYIRITGIILLAGTVAYLLIGRKWKLALIISVAFLITASPWYLRNSMIKNRYSGIMKINSLRPEQGDMKTVDFIKRIKNNAKRYISLEIPNAIMGYEITNNEIYENPQPKDTKWISGILFIVLALAGLFFIGKYRWIFIVYLSGTALLLIIFPDVWVGTRYMLPVVPLLFMLIILSAYKGLLWVSEKINIKENFRVSFLPFVFLIFIFVLKDGVSYLVKAKNEGHYYPGFSKYVEVAQWAKTNIPQNSIVACRKPEFFYLYSDCKTTGYEFNLDGESVLAKMKADNVTHVVYDGLGFASTGRYLMPAIKKYPEKFKELIHLKYPDTYLFELHYDCGYEGEMKDGKRNGMGICRYSDGSVYEGEWKNNLKEGQGKLTGTNGVRYEGEFLNNVRYGKGEIYDKHNVKRLEGVWINDKKNGYFKVYDYKGKLIKETVMKDDKFVAGK